MPSQRRPPPSEETRKSPEEFYAASSWRPPPLAPKKRTLHGQNFRDVIEKGWPTMNKSPTTGKRLYMTILPENGYQPSVDERDQAALFNSAAGWVSQLQRTHLTTGQQDVLEEML
ncbi:hypothetical protein CP532_3654 [Ophiocordyceps camponoti-leonardi (nom. inval.)]|nr:hypothetical protein CP532_3654 [Ophiocordyceps camponoti-leonardi (nom. inval.)]